MELDVELLARLYESEDKARSLIHRAKLDLRRFDFAGSGLVMWTKLLVEAEKQPDDLEKLAAVVRVDYPSVFRTEQTKPASAATSSAARDEVRTTEPPAHRTSDDSPVAVWPRVRERRWQPVAVAGALLGVVAALVVIAILRWPKSHEPAKLPEPAQWYDRLKGDFIIDYSPGSAPNAEQPERVVMAPSSGGFKLYKEGDDVEHAFVMLDAEYVLGFLWDKGTIWAVKKRSAKREDVELYPERFEIDPACRYVWIQISKG